MGVFVVWVGVRVCVRVGVCGVGGGACLRTCWCVYLCEGMCASAWVCVGGGEVVEGGAA